MEKPFELGKESLKVTLVFPTKKITEINVAVGESVSLDCVSSNGEITWRKLGDTTWSISNAKGVTVEHGTLKIHNVNVHDQGKYECSAIPPPKDFSVGSSRKVHDIVRAIYEVKVAEKPVAVLNVTNTNTEGVIQVQCSAGSETNHPQLFLNGRPLLSDGGGSVRVLSTKYDKAKWIYTIAVDHKFKTVFQCIVKPSGQLYSEGASENVLFFADAPISTTPAERSSPLLANVDDTPRIEDPPENTTRMQMESATLICQVSMNVRKVIWLKDGKPFDTSSSRMNVFGSGTLSISQLKLEDKGLYTCVAMGFHKNVTADAYLDVQENDYLRLLPNINADLFLPPPKLMTSTEKSRQGQSWKYDEGDDYEKLPGKVPDLPEKNRELPEKAVTVDVGAVEEMGSGFTGTTTAFEDHFETTTETARTRPYLEVVDEDYSNLDTEAENKWRPEAPTVHIINHYSAVVTMPQIHKLDVHKFGWVTHFKVQWKKGKETYWLTSNEDIPASSRQHTLYGLKPGARYKFRVGVAFDRKTVTSKASKYVRIPTLNEIEVVKPLETPPTITNTKSVSQDAIEVKWEYPSVPGTTVDGFIISFQINYGNLKDNGNPVLGGNITVEGDLTREAQIDSLLPATNYIISMQAYNSAGKSHNSINVTETTLRVDGTRPPVQAVTQISDTNVYLAPSKDASNKSLDGVLTKSAKKKILFSLSSTTLLIILVVFLAIIFTILALCLIICTCRERKKTKARLASEGRFQDTSKRLFIEEHSKGKLALYHEALSAQPDEVQAMLDPPQMYGVDEMDSNRNRVDTPAMKGSTFGMNTSSTNGLPVMNLYATAHLLDSSADSVRDRSTLRAGTPPGYHPDSVELGSEEERQTSTPECDTVLSGPAYLSMPPPPMATSSPSPHPLSLSPFHRGYLSPYHSILNAAGPNPGGTSALAPMAPNDRRSSNSSNEQGSTRIPVLHLHTTSATVSPATSATDGSDSPHRYRSSPPERPLRTTPLKRGGSSGGPVSPMGNLSAAQYEAMWTRGGDGQQGVSPGTGGSLRMPRQETDTSPHFYSTFKPQTQGQRSNYSPLRTNNSVPMQQTTAHFEGYMSDDH